MFQLSEELIFPNPKYADETGLLAIGGDLSVNRLLLAYTNGIFPWFEDQGDIFWYAPQPRFVLFPKQVKVHKSMQKWMDKTTCTITENKAFEQVIQNCAAIKRTQEDSTWISNQFKQAYMRLHELGFAKSIEIWQNNKLVGGLYGVQLNNCFFGESMFHTVSNASKLALIHLCKRHQYKLIDCQTHTPHLEFMGAEFIDFDDFLEIIQQ